MSMIHVENLVKTFGEVKAVDHVSFDVAEGEIFAFLGPNGAGKTTTIQMLTTLLAPTSGTIAIDGIDPRKHPHDVRRRFGIVWVLARIDSVDRDRRNRSAQAPARCPPALRNRVPGSQPRRRAHGLRKHGASRGALPRAAPDDS